MADPPPEGAPPSGPAAVEKTPVAPKLRTFLPSLEKFRPAVEGGPKIPVRVTCFEVLKEAKKDPWDWFSRFADDEFTFLGRRFTGGVHEVLSKHLRTKETELIEVANEIEEKKNKGSGGGDDDDKPSGGASAVETDIDDDEGDDSPNEADAEEEAPGPPKATPKTKLSALKAGTVLGLAGPPDFKNGILIRGARKKPTKAKLSMHFFGLAIDVDFDFNFYPETAGRTAVNNVLREAKALFEPTEAAQEAPDVPWGWPKNKKDKFKNLGFDDAKKINDNLVRLFALIDDTAELDKLRKAAKAKPWIDFEDADAAKAHIEKNLSDAFSVIRKKKGAKTATEKTLEIAKKTGFMTLPKKVHDGLGLSWGGAYGDTMHFDARNLTGGKPIRRAIKKFKKDAALQKKLADAWKDFEGKSESEMLEEFKKKYPKKS